MFCHTAVKSHQLYAEKMSQLVGKERPHNIAKIIGHKECIDTLIEVKKYLLHFK